MRKISAFFTGLGMLVWLYVFGSMVAVIQRIITVGPRVARSPFGRHVQIVTSLCLRCAAAWFYITLATHLRGLTILLFLVTAVFVFLTAVIALVFNDQLYKPRMRQLMAWSNAFAYIGVAYWVARSIFEGSWFYSNLGLGTIFSAGCLLALCLVWRLLESQPQRDPGIEFAPLR